MSFAMPDIPVVPYPDFVTFDIEGLLSTMAVIIVLVFMLVLMVTLFKKCRIFVVILLVWIISLIIGLSYLIEGGFLFGSVLFIVFILLQTLFFLLTLIDFFNSLKGIKRG